MRALAILLIILILAGLGVGGYFGYKKWFSKGRKYIQVKDDKHTVGKCTGTDGTVSPGVKSSRDCAKACDTAPSSAPCNGYDWDETTCTLYASAPTAAKFVTQGKDKCYALSK